MSSEQTRDAEAVDLNFVARGVVEGDPAAGVPPSAPCAVVGAAVLTETAIAPGLPLRHVWSFGWGAAGSLWTHPPAGASGTAPRAAAHNIFDLASVSKPVTALTLARLQREGVMHRDQPLGEVLPEAAGTASAGVSLDLLLSHRAGLEAHIEFFVKEAGATQPQREVTLARAAAARRADCTGSPPPDGFPVVYSDLGYILAGAAMEHRTGRALDDLVEEHVTRPLGLTLGSIRKLRAKEPAFDQRVVPTENVPWRGGVVRGVVHDENAWVLADRGSAGHAGLFGDVWSVVRLGTSILDAWRGRKDKWLSRDDLEPLLRERPGGSHRAGFDGRAAEDGTTPSSGAHFGPESFGHLGFTGTSVWMDPAQALVGVLLTNRVHPSRDHIAIRQARPRAYDALHRAMVALR